MHRAWGRAVALAAVRQRLVARRLAVKRSRAVVRLTAGSRRCTALVELGVHAAHVVLCPLLLQGGVGREPSLVRLASLCNILVVDLAEPLTLFRGLLAVDHQLSLDLGSLLAGLLALFLLLDLHLRLRLAVKRESLDVVLGDAHRKSEACAGAKSQISVPSPVRARPQSKQRTLVLQRLGLAQLVSLMGLD